MGNEQQDHPPTTVHAPAVAPTNAPTDGATKGRRPRRTGARDRILAAAVDLFYREGLRTTGIDRIIAEAGVAKASFYEHFESKDALMEAYVGARSAAFDVWFQEWMTARFGGAQPGPAPSITGREQLLATIEAVAEFASAPEFRGCAFIGVTEQIDDASHPARAAAECHRAKVRDSLVGWARVAGAPDPERLGLSLSMLVDGLLVAARAAVTAAERQRAIEATRTAWEAVINASLHPRTTEPPNH